jgi:hypothetical protein
MKVVVQVKRHVLSADLAWGFLALEVWILGATCVGAEVLFAALLK